MGMAMAMVMMQLRILVMRLEKTVSLSLGVDALLSTTTNYWVRIGWLAHNQVT